MKSLKGIASFVSVASTGSFAKAARQQGVSAVAVGKNVATLERQLGVRLFQRTTRKLTLTTEGQSYLDQCQGPLRELEAAQVSVQKSSKALSGLVRVTSVVPFGTGFVLPLLPKFHARHPKVQVQLHLDDAVSNIVADSYDVGIRVGQLKDASFIARSIAPLPFVVCASPSYFQRRGKPVSLSDLADQNCLRFSRVGSHDPMPWFLTGLDASLDAKLPCNFLINDFAALIQAAVAGQGLACVPLPLAMPLFRAKRLLPALTEHIRSDLMVYLHYPNRKNLPARTRAFVDFVLDQLGREADLQTDAQTLVEPFLSV
jgi:DNA-binding transcriptional LysR family regulator